ncbi:MAG: hypothetical protein BWY63_01637 [Chloroflexi bacterium ADurb.Bin360]|nr:MAG: hypothetical protein BWY63_01637 [Chloroflexi bacterium ADurb.Bin360]
MYPAPGDRFSITTVVSYFVTALLAVLIFTSCVNEKVDNKVTTMTKAQFGEFAGIWLPKNIRDLQIYSEQGIDTIVIARFSFTPDLLSQFLTESQFATNPIQGYRPFQDEYGADISWWNTQGLTTYAGLADRYGKVYRKILFDLSDNTIVTVYCVAFTT